MQALRLWYVHICIEKKGSRGPKLGTYSDWGLSSVLVINKHLSHHIEKKEKESAREKEKKGDIERKTEKEWE